METKRYRLKTVTFNVSEPAGALCGDPDALVPVFAEIFANLDQDREHVVVLALNNKNRAIGYKVSHTGGANASNFEPRIIFRDALALGAVNIAISHNHPSGDSFPSANDKAATEGLVQAGEVVGIRVLDHIVYGTGTGSWYSFYRNGQISWGNK